MSRAGAFSRACGKGAACLCACLAVTWMVPSGLGAYAAEGDGKAVYEKSEVVYANLSADGAVEGVYTVNGFEVEQAGSIVDHGSYDSVKALNEDVPLEQEGDAVSFDASEGVFYYQGTADAAELPWDIEVSYELDGQEVSADQLAGSTGDVEMHLTSTRNAAVDDTYAASFVLQVTFTLPSEACSDIVAEGGSVAEAGADKNVSFTVLPGEDADCTVSCTARDFSMDGIQIAAVPYSMAVEMPDTDGMIAQFDQLSDAIGQLSDGAGALAEGVDAAGGGADALTFGSEELGRGLSQLSASAGELSSASHDIDAALGQLDAMLGAADFSQLEQLGKLPASLRGLAGQLDTLVQATGVVKDASDELGEAWEAVGEALQAAQDAGPNDGEIAKLEEKLKSPDCALDETQAETVRKLIDEHEALKDALGVYEGRQEAVETALEELGGFDLSQSAGVLSQTLRTVADGIEGSSGDLAQLGQLADAVSALADQYGQFDDGLAKYARGVEALDGSYGSIAKGNARLSDAFVQLGDAARQLADGMETLNASTSVLPEQVREQMAELLADYEFPTFDGRSFASAENGTVESVQFVLTTAPVQKAEPEVVEQQEQPETLWDRIVGLFS